MFGFIKKIFKREKHHIYYTFENDLSEEEIAENREQILGLLNGIDRKGMDKVIKYMERNNFFEVPSSIHHYHNYKGGLAQHVLSVYHIAREQYPDLDGDSLVVACIFHDLCKSDLWHYDKKGGLHRNHGKSQRRGAKSIKILNECGFDIDESERLAIRWHMGGDNAHSDEIEDANRARNNPLWKALFKANKLDSSNS